MSGDFEFDDEIRVVRRHMPRWLTIAEAAHRVERSTATIHRWHRQGRIMIAGGRVPELELINLDALMKKRTGRPRGSSRRSIWTRDEDGSARALMGHATLAEDGTVRIELTDARILQLLKRGELLQVGVGEREIRDQEPRRPGVRADPFLG